MSEKPRPEGFDYSKPDAEQGRCQTCNAGGMNRTGWRIVGRQDAITSCGVGYDCPAKCNNGLWRGYGEVFL